MSLVDVELLRHVATDCLCRINTSSKHALNCIVGREIVRLHPALVRRVPPLGSRVPVDDRACGALEADEVLERFAASARCIADQVLARVVGVQVRRQHRDIDARRHA